MLFIYIMMIPVGICLMGWGFWSAYNLRKPWNSVNSLFAPVGLVIALTGVLLVCVPNFFSG